MQITQQNAFDIGVLQLLSLVTGDFAWQPLHLARDAIVYITRTALQFLTTAELFVSDTDFAYRYVRTAQFGILHGLPPVKVVRDNSVY